MKTYNTKCGVYKIYCKATGRTYIGSSCRIEYRWTDHKRALKNHVHPNYLIQKDYDVYGIDAFEFSIVEECNDDEKLKREKYYAENVYKCMNIDGGNEFGYNLAPYVDVGYAIKQHVPHQLLRYDEVYIIKVLLCIGFSVNTISQIFHAKYKTISDIKSLETYSFVANKFNDFLGNPSFRNIFTLNIDPANVIEFLDRKFDLSNLSNNISFIRNNPFVSVWYLTNIKRQSDLTERYCKNEIIDFDSVNIYDGDFNTLMSIHNDIYFSIMFYIICSSMFDCDSGCRISYFSETNLITVMKLKITHSEYMEAIDYLVQNNYISVNKQLYCFELAYDITSIHSTYTIDSSCDIRMCCNLLKNKCGISNQKIGICNYCGKMFIQNKNKNALYCIHHRGYLKKSDELTDKHIVHDESDYIGTQNISKNKNYMTNRPSNLNIDKSSILNKQQFIDLLSLSVNKSKNDIEDCVNLVLDGIKYAYSNHSGIKFVGFGTFTTKSTKDRVGTNPYTLEQIDIKGQVYPNVVFGKDVKEIVANS